MNSMVDVPWQHVSSPEIYIIGFNDDLKVKGIQHRKMLLPLGFH